MQLEFTVPGRPVPKMRPRIVSRKRKTARGVETFPVAITPDKTRAYEAEIGRLAVIKRPAGWPKNGRYAVHVDIAIAPTKAGKPRKIDPDNVYKSVLDGCNGLIWDDDCQVYRGSYCREDDNNESVRVRVTVEE